MAEVKKVRHFIFLKDVLLLGLTAFGGPQAHMAYFQKNLVQKKRYLTEEELLEINALCQVLPGPTSTQTITAIGYKLGGPNLAYLTLFLWMLPAVILMTATGIIVSSLEAKQMSLEFTRFIQPMAVGFISYAAYTISLKSVNTWPGILIMIGSAVLAYFIRNPFIFPLIIIIAGLLTAFKYRKQEKEEKKDWDVPWRQFFLWLGVLVIAAVLGGITKKSPNMLPARLFENFYRSGSLAFGGGQSLTPMLHTEFVRFAKKQQGRPDEERKPLMSNEEFLSGYAVAQTVPGPMFSFSSYIGAVVMRESGITGKLIGAFVCAAGIFLPGTFLIFFMMRVWESLKKFRPIKASLEGISAANAGLVASAAIVLFQPLENTVTNFGFTIGTFCLLAFTKSPSWLIVLVGLVIGLVWR